MDERPRKNRERYSPLFGARLLHFPQGVKLFFLGEDRLPLAGAQAIGFGEEALADA
jgi:hypothetical protein